MEAGSENRAKKRKFEVQQKSDSFGKIRQERNSVNAAVQQYQG